LLRISDPGYFKQSSPAPVQPWRTANPSCQFSSHGTGKEGWVPWIHRQGRLALALEKQSSDRRWPLDLVWGEQHHDVEILGGSVDSKTRGWRNNYAYTIPHVIFEVHSLHFAFLIPMQPKQETAVGRFHSISFIGLLSIWVKTLVPRAIFFVARWTPAVWLWVKPLGTSSLDCLITKKPCFMCGSEVLKCGYSCIILYRLAILVGDNPLETSSWRRRWYHPKASFSRINWSPLIFILTVTQKFWWWNDETRFHVWTPLWWVDLRATLRLNPKVYYVLLFKHAVLL
jgi:hypothetical protein